MNPLQRALIEKTGNDNGFEHVVASDAACVTLASARHTNRALVGLEGGAYHVSFQTCSFSLLPELLRSFPDANLTEDTFQIATEANLANLLRRAASLSRALPSQAADEFQQAVASELAELPAGIAGTEVERIVRQRVGQHKFRAVLMEYWGGACAVTGVTLPDVLRASHARPWSECSTDQERLNVFNGLLLCANLDALFDRFLIGFDEKGAIVFSNRLRGIELQRLGVFQEMKLRWMSHEHLEFLVPHMERVLEAK